MGTRQQAYDLLMQQMGTYGGDPYWRDYFGYDWVSPGGTPHCACGVTWVLKYSNTKSPFFPCPWAFDWTDDLEGRGVDRWSLEWMDPIAFDWDGDGLGDHVGFFLRYLGDGLAETSEFNTSGGENKICVRYVEDIICGIRPYYDDAPEADSKPHNNRDGGVLEVDGCGGWNTIIDWQNQMGTEEDGVVSGQSRSDDPWRAQLFSYDYDGDGSALMVEVGNFLLAKGYKLGPAGANGVWGWWYSGAIQQFLADTGYYDGYIDHDFGTHSMSGLQRSLNDGKVWCL